MGTLDVVTVGVAVGTLATAAGSVAAAFKERQTRAVPSGTLEDRIKKLSQTMAESAKLIEEVSAEMELRAVTVKQLQQEAKDAQAMKALNAEQVAAVEHVLQATLRPETDRGIRWALIAGLLGFLAGTGATVLTTLFVHPLN